MYNSVPQLEKEEVLWVVTKDLISNEKEGDTSNIGKGQTFEDYERRTFFRIWIHEDLATDAIQDAVRFRLKDDDGEIYYEGLMRADTIYCEDEDIGCGPLNWAKNDSGCTEMEINQSDRWEGYIS